MVHRSYVIVGLMVLGACRHDDSVSADTEIVCANDADCPGAMHCDARLSRCRFEPSEPVCGDGILDEGEQCDCGNAPGQVPERCVSSNSDTLPNRCRTNCQLPGCGDGVVDEGERCDDGNLEPGDGCSIICEVERCGNGVIDPDEVCDDGNVVGGDGCSADCNSDESCNNGITDFAAGELCDCGDGSLALPPGCEAPNGAPSGSCTADCKTVYCGNGVVNDGEVCDDGNTRSGDGCSGDCLSDESCGNGYVDVAADPPEQCDMGSDNADTPDAPCRTDCTQRQCGDGVVDVGSGEDCEPGAEVQASCADFGFYDGSLGCGDDCRYDPENTCTGFCGDGVVTFPELCDGSVEQACAELGYGAGLPACTDRCTYNVSTCDLLGWQPESLPSVGGTFSAVHGSSPEHIWVVGTDSLALRYNGVRWSSVDLPSNINVHDVWALSESAVYMVGSSAGSAGDLLHYDGTAVDVIEPTDPSVFDAFRAVSAASEQDVFVAGGNGRILHYDGQTLTTMYNQTGLRLEDIHARADNDVYAVGSFGSNQEGRILHYDGEDWSYQTPSARQSLRAVHAVTADDVWATGARSLVMRKRDNGEWKTLRGPDYENPHTLTTVVGADAQSVRIGGQSGAVLRFNGAVLVEDELEGSLTLSHLWASPDGQVFGIGSAPEAPLLMRYSGRHWMPPTHVDFRDNDYQNHAIWGTSPTNVWLGERDRVWHWDGATWQGSFLGDDSGSFHGMWGTDTDDILAVGVGGAFSDEARIAHYKGGDWSVQTITGARGLRDIDGAAGLVLAVGDAGTILRRTAPTTFAADASGVTNHLYGVAVRDANRAYAAGVGVVLTYDGTEWRNLRTDSDHTWRDVWVAPNGDVVVVGDGGAAARYDGAWHELDTGTSFRLDAIWGTSGSDVFMVGKVGTVLHYDGTGVAPVRNSTAEEGRPHVTAIWGQLGGDIFFVSSPDTLQRLHYERALGD